MAEPETVQQKEIEEKLCSIEASVVTGFEECARGEAKEKFGTAVYAARGKIAWKVPINRVKEVVKMGSIDNCRVILHSIPHFKFTNDQHDSLARLQKMVPDMDWEQGLCVWRQFFDFPHPIASKPEVIPSPEDLIDVVIVERKQVKDPNARRNNKKGVRGKKKDRKRDKKNEKHEDNVKSEEGCSGKESTEREDDKKESEAMCNDNQNATVDSFVESKSQPVTGCESSQQANIVSETEIHLDIAKDVSEEASSESLESEKVLEISEEISKLQESEENPRKEDDGRTCVIIRRADPNQPPPKIEVKVLIPGPSDNAFPTHLDEKDNRDLEPMDVDLSMNIGNETIDKSTVEDKDTLAPNKDAIECPSADKSADPENCFHQPSLEDKENQSKNKVSEATKDFASSVIEKLKSSSPPPVKVLSPSQEKVTCPTPPSTPVILSTDPLTTDCDVSQCPSASSTVKDDLACCDEERVCGSSVDPPSLLESCRNVVSAMTNASKKGEEILTPSAEAVITDVKSEEPPSSKEISEDSSNSPERREVPVKKERDPTKPTFRVTCHRIGDCHAFDSSSAAASLGSAIMKYFNWGVDLKNFDIEILLNIENEEVSVGIGLTKFSLHNRNLVAFGPTTLRATICYNMLRLCRIKTGDIVCDPMCGTSALPIEGAMNWVNSFHFGGDYHELAIERSVKNMAALRDKHEEEKRGNLKIGVVQWNLNSFPLRDKCVDVFVSDLPFGYRMGSRTVNRTLYPTLLSEMARTGRSGARACLLTEDKTSLIKAIQTLGRFWQRRLILNVNMGGLSAFVFLLTRTTASFSPQLGMGRGSETTSATAEGQGKKQLSSSPSQKEAEASSNISETNGKEEQPLESDSQAVSSTKAPADMEGTVNELLSTDADSQNASICEETVKEVPKEAVREIASNSDTCTNTDSHAALSCEETKE